MRVLEDALRLLVLYAEKQMTLRSSKSDYCPKEDSAAIEATKTIKVRVVIHSKAAQGWCPIFTFTLDTPLSFVFFFVLPRSEFVSFVRAALH